MPIVIAPPGNDMKINQFLFVKIIQLKQINDAGPFHLIDIPEVLDTNQDCHGYWSQQKEEEVSSNSPGMEHLVRHHIKQGVRHGAFQYNTVSKQGKVLGHFSWAQIEKQARYMAH